MLLLFQLFFLYGGNTTGKSLKIKSGTGELNQIKQDLQAQSRCHSISGKPHQRLAYKRMESAPVSVDQPVGSLYSICQSYSPSYDAVRDYKTVDYSDIADG